MFNTEFSEQDVKDVLRFINDGDQSVLDGDAVSKLFILSGALYRKTVSEVKALRRENTLLKRRLERFTTREESMALSGEFECEGANAVLVAKALMYCIQRVNAGSDRYSLSRVKLHILLYDVYADYLRDYRKRLTVDIPKAYGYIDRDSGKEIRQGPVFWTVKNALDADIKAGHKAAEADYRTLEDICPEAAGLCWGVAKKYGLETDSALLKWILPSAPARAADKTNNNGRWGKEYDDALIYQWKKEQIDPSSK